MNNHFSDGDCDHKYVTWIVHISGVKSEDWFMRSSSKNEKFLFHRSLNPKNYRKDGLIYQMFSDNKNEWYINNLSRKDQTK